MLFLITIILSLTALLVTIGWQATLSLFILNLTFFLYHARTITTITQALKALSDALVALADELTKGQQ